MPGRQRVANILFPSGLRGELIAVKKHLFILGAAILVGANAQAGEPENYIKYRQAVMKAIGGHTGAASQIVRGKVAPEGALAMHAKALADLSTNITQLFPEGSDFGETKAKEVIWEQWDKFEKAAVASKQATAAFSEAAASGDAERISAAFKDVGKSCKGCHKDFRQKDD